MSVLVEVKAIPKGRWALRFDEQVEAIDTDIERLARHLQLGRTAAAVMVDDFDAYAHRRSKLLCRAGAASACVPAAWAPATRPRG